MIEYSWGADALCMAVDGCVRITDIKVAGGRCNSHVPAVRSIVDAWLG